MIVIIVDASGNVKYRSSEAIHQGSVDANKVMLVGPFPSAVITVAATLPNGKIYGYDLLKATDEEKAEYALTSLGNLGGAYLDGSELFAYSYTLKGALTAKAGTLKLQFFINVSHFVEDGKIESAMLPTDNVNVTITNGSRWLPADPVAPNNIYSEIVENLAALTGAVNDAKNESKNASTEAKESADDAWEHAHQAYEIAARVDLRESDNSSALSDRIFEIEKFFEVAEGETLNEARDTLIEIQQYIDEHGNAAGLLAEQVTTNTQNIAKNGEDIINNSKSIAHLEEQVNTNNQNIDSAKTSIQSNTLAIASNAANISANAENIIANTKAINTNKGSIETLTENETWDLVITAEKLEGTNLNTVLTSASGRVFVKAIDNSTTINVPSAIKLIEFAPSVVFETEVNIVGSDDTDTGYNDDCQIIRGATIRIDNMYITNLPTIRNFKGGVEHCHGIGWSIKDCNNIEHCTFLRMENCYNISHCNIGKGYNYGSGTMEIVNCSNIEDLIITDEMMGGWQFTNCQFIRDIKSSASLSFGDCQLISNVVSTYWGGTSFANCKIIRDILASDCTFNGCEYISNVAHNPSPSFGAQYNNCKYVDAYTCVDFINPADLGKAQVLTDDGTFSAAAI